MASDRRVLRPAPEELVRVPRAAEIVAARLRSQIVRGELGEGDRLPSETVLSERFGVSKPTLREAFRVLESEALLSVHRGVHGGARVHAPKRSVVTRYAALVLQHEKTTVSDVYEARVLIEPSVVRRLAEDPRQETVEELDCLVQEADRATDPIEAANLLLEFHHRLVELAGNRTLGLMMSVVSDILLHSTTVHGEADLERTRQELVVGNRAHRDLVKLIAAGAVRKAENLWVRHLQYSVQRQDDFPPDEPLIDLLD